MDENTLRQIYEHAKANNNTSVAISALQQLNSLAAPRLAKAELPPDPVEDTFKGLARGGLKGLDFTTYPLRALAGVPELLSAEIFGPDTEVQTTGGRLAEKVGEFAVPGGAISSIAKRAAPALAPHFKTVRDASLAALSGLTGQGVREAPQFPGQEAAATATEILTPFGAAGGAKLLTNFPAAQQALKLAGKLPTVQAIRDTKRMLTKSGQTAAADDVFRNLAGTNKSQMLRELDRAEEIYGQAATVGGITKNPKLRAVEEAYRRSDKWVPQADQISDKFSALNAAYSRGIEYGSMPAAAYAQNRLLSKMADKLPDWSLPSIKRFIEKFPEEIETIIPDSPLAHAFNEIKASKPSGINFFLNKSANNWNVAKKLLGGEPYVKVDRLFNRRLRPERIADDLMKNVKTPSQYEAVVQITASNFADRIEAWAKNLMQSSQIAKTTGEVPDQIEIAKRFHSEFNRAGMTKAFEKIFRDKSAREIFQTIKSHMGGYATELAKDVGIPEIPNRAVSIGGKVLGARVGRKISALGGGGSDIQTPGIFSKAFGDAAASATGQHFHTRIVELLTDKAAAKAVLSGKTSVVEYIKHGRSVLSLGRLSGAPVAFSGEESP